MCRWGVWGAVSVYVVSVGSSQFVGGQCVGGQCGGQSVCRWSVRGAVSVGSSQCVGGQCVGGQ